MENWKRFFLVFVLIFFVQIASAAHYITGYVNNALDGEIANGKVVTLWKYSNGQTDNVTDFVGPTGKSGYSNVFLIDCEMLSSPCQNGDIVSVKIFGTDYISNTVNVTVSVFGYDVADNLSINSPPVPGLIHPLNGDNVSADIDFNCSYFDYDDDISQVSFWGNWGGPWIEISSSSLGPISGYATINQILSQGNYIWNCLVEDSFGISKFSSSNNSFFVDATAPVINSVNVQEVEICGFGNVRVNCSTYDEDTSIGNVLIESIFEGNPIENYTADFLSGNIYFANPNVNEVGNWSFRCYVNDSVGNSANLESGEIKVMSGNPEIAILDNLVTFGKSPDYETEPINVSVNIQNLGCGTASNFIVGFFNGERPSGHNFANKTISILELSNLVVSGFFPAEIGSSNIFVYVDLDNSLIEDNESNNEANRSIYLKSWQKIFGNLSLDRILSGFDVNRNMTSWEGENDFMGNIFIADSEAQIQWTYLQSIGRTKTDDVSSDDFLEIDNSLGTSFFNDSIYDLFTNSGDIKEFQNLTVFQNEINNVPVINSSSNGNFKTGILWDTSDSVDDKYDSTEREDIVFVTEINRGAIGHYGIYDYEIEIPAKLRDYNSGEASLVYLYYDLN